MTIEQLQKFCTRDELRPSMQQPYTIDKHTYATDGVVIIRIPAMNEVPFIQSAPDPEPLFVKCEVESFTSDLSHIPGPTMTVCPTCLGKKRLEECNKCEGAGEHVCECGHHHDCESCDGLGDVPSDNPTADECDSCDGIGQVAKRQEVHIGPRKFNLQRLELVRHLPTFRIADSGSSSTGAYFTFEGGDGILMPLRQD
jgi:hypothetical protein